MNFLSFLWVEIYLFFFSLDSQKFWEKVPSLGADQIEKIEKKLISNYRLMNTTLNIWLA